MSNAQRNIAISIIRNQAPTISRVKLIFNLVFATIVLISTIVIFAITPTPSWPCDILNNYKYVSGIYVTYCLLYCIQSILLYTNRIFTLIDVSVHVVYFAMLIISIYGLRLSVQDECISHPFYILGQVFMWSYFVGLFASALLAFILTAFLSWVLLCNPRVLARTIERVGPNTTGISHEVVQTLNHQHYNPYTSSIINTTCTICMSDYASGDEFIILPCGDGKHHFHKACIEPWLLRNATCPCCRTTISTRPTTAAAAP